MTKLIKKFFRNEDGASAAEYALILAVIGGGIAIAAGGAGHRRRWRDQ
jgi:pilus assembly protein Flp/PilA